VGWAKAKEIKLKNINNVIPYLMRISINFVILACPKSFLKERFLSSRNDTRRGRNDTKFSGFILDFTPYHDKAFPFNF
jgi:hypothetical protein